MSSDESLLTRLAQDQDSDAWASVAATAPADEAPSQPGGNESLDNMLQRINSLAATPPNDPASEATPAPTPAAPAAAAPAAAAATTPTASPTDEFFPREPKSIEAAGLNTAEVEWLVMKLLLARGDIAGREVAEHLKLPFILIEDLLRGLKQEQMLVYRGSTAMNDYIYQLTDLGRERARRHAAHCTYYGSAPVTLRDYIASVKRQSLETQYPTEADLERAFQDLLINKQMLAKLGPAINSGRGLFLYGFPGNGKTSIAERVTGAFGQTIWIPRAISVDGEIIRMFDPVNHEEMPLQKADGLLDQSRIDHRWIRIRRPTIVVGGELTMENLEVSLNASTGISEAPVQLKSNCGTLVIDDFGRQRMSIDELLNRWIVPLEKRYDFLNLPNGKKVQVPFDQLIIFSTNLEPRDLVDDAFLRRIPYKVEVQDPTEQEFRELFDLMCDKCGITMNVTALDHLINEHYKSVDRPFRCCQPRDLLLQVRNHCRYQKIQPKLSVEMLDMAVETYFAVM